MKNLHDGEIHHSERALTAFMLILRALALFAVVAIRLIIKAVVNVCAIVIGFVIGFLVVTRLSQ